ncbi:MAG: hypothetical protein H7318_09750 [Oligoflexus sp.]|nr:hypothetical protein [Oligoflexus sp.]
MGRKKLPEELKKRQISLTFSGEVYRYLKGLEDPNSFVEDLVKPHVPEKRVKSPKQKKGTV